jgi:hypothetical protein
VKGETKGKFCKEHAHPDMIDVKHKTCEICETRPSYNVKGETKARFCAEHAQPNMIDVTHKTCEEPDCLIIATYGLLGQGTSRCASHRLKDMITYPNRKCCASLCKELGCFEYQGTRYCEDHLKPNKENVINLGLFPCGLCGLPGILTNNKCETCDPEVIKVRTKAKENRVRDIFTSLKITFVHDKILDSSASCGRERPDFVIDCEDHYVIFEVDENQHASYACECEQTRMINLVQACGGMPVTFIRYNPDVYEPHGKQKMLSLEQREKKMLEYLKLAVRNSPKERGDFANVLYLFYDGHDSTEPSWHSLIRI